LCPRTVDEADNSPALGVTDVDGPHEEWVGLA